MKPDSVFDYVVMLKYIRCVYCNLNMKVIDSIIF